MPLNVFQNFLFDDSTMSIPHTTGPITFTDDGVTFTLTPFGLPGGAAVRSRHEPGPDPGGTTVTPAGLVGPSQTQGVAILPLAPGPFGATLEVNGGTFSGFGGPSVNGTFFLGVGGGLVSIATGWNISLLTTGGGTIPWAPIPTGPQAIVPVIDPANVNISGIRFVNSTGSFAPLFINGITVNATCYCAGTAIATPEGPRAVETLVPGDIITTAGGRQTTVRWLGEQNIDGRLHHPAKVNPICIRAGSLGPDLPVSDLHVSPDHGIGIDGLLINAGALVNNSSIYQIANMPRDGFTYYHIETDAHELILAEGIAAETFVDYAARDSFANAEERGDTPKISEIGLPRISSARLLPKELRHRLMHEMAA